MGTALTTLSIFTLLIHITASARTFCAFPLDNCLCVWDLGIDNMRHANGQYRLVAPSPSPTSKKWIMNDVKSPQSAQPCSTYAKMFWYATPCAGRWYLGDQSYDGSCDGNCFCNANGIADPLSDSCPVNTYDCFYTIFDIPPETIHLYDALTVTFGACPTITSTCTRIGVTADAPRDFCNGIYEISDSPTGKLLDNEINIYTNPDQTRRNRFIYYDHHSQRWVCAEQYKPCMNSFSTQIETNFNTSFDGLLIYVGKVDDPGAPDPFKSSSAITTRSTWDVLEWSNGPQDVGSVTVTFECNPPTPSPVSSPTLATSAPTQDPTEQPSKSPTNDPSGAPIIQPTKAPTRNPSQTPTRTPTGTPSQAPVKTPHPTSTPSETPSNSPTKNPLGAPTQNPLRQGDTHSPTRSPTTPFPSTSPTTPRPTISPTINPSDQTLSPTRNPLRQDETHGPSKNPTEPPTEPIPTPKPTQLTYPPTEDPTKEPVGDGGGDDGADDDGADDEKDISYGYMLGNNMRVIVMLVIGYLIFC